MNFVKRETKKEIASANQAKPVEDGNQNIELIVSNAAKLLLQCQSQGGNPQNIDQNIIMAAMQAVMTQGNDAAKPDWQGNNKMPLEWMMNQNMPNGQRDSQIQESVSQLVNNFLDTNQKHSGM